MQALGNVREGGRRGGAPRPAGRSSSAPRPPGKDDPGHLGRRPARPRRSTRTPQGTFVYNQADTTGLYHARWEPDGLLPFAVNLFDFRESDLAPRGLVPEGVPESQAEAYKIKIGYNPVAGTQQAQDVQQDWWKYLAVRGARRCCCSSGTSTTSASISE